ncbi:T9SS type A sorting domain-containing protein [Flavobacteriales bacterium]|nr:T9SS type A sorting domain-containing protein [Flavobacteriales bacterium]MDC1352818.1 T9SS type A sorting domain-containing protein [Flavobacteriales bacterium]
MKKNYFLVSLMLVFISFSGYSQLTAPFVEQFNSGTFPTTWTQSATLGGPWITGGIMGYNASTIADHTGTAGSSFTWLDYSGTGETGVIMMSDTIDVSSVPKPELSFWFNNNLGTNPCDPFNSLFIEGYDGTSWVVIDLLQQDNLGVWSEHYYDLCSFIMPGNKVLVRFRAESGATNSGSIFYHDLAIDDISVDTLRVNCFLPQALNVDTSTITISTAVLKWSAGCSDTAWSVKYGLTGFDPLVTGNYVHTNIDSLLVTSLNDITTYDFYVRSYCNLGDTSTWAGPFTFTTLPLCIAPTNQSISNLTATSVTLRWNAGGGPLADTAWSIVHGATGFALPAGGTYVHVNVDSLNISGLLPVTSYDFYVRGYCNSGDTSAWVGPFTFTTPCSSYVPTYLEDFTSMTFSATPNCWEEGQGLLTVNSSIVMGTSNWGSDVFGNATGASNSAYLNLWTTNRNDWLISPSIDLGTGALPYQVEFDIALTAYANTSATTLGVDDSVTFLISTDNGTTWSDTNILMSWNSTTSPISPTGQFQAFNLTNAGYTGLVRFAFYCESTASNADNDVFVDNFSVRFVPTCPRPLNLRTSSIYSDSVNLTWDTAATDSIYFLEYGTPGFALGTGTPLTSNTDSTFINGLLPNTTYEVYLRSFCTVGDTSLWTGPFTFTTPCASFTPPYLEDFSTYAFNNNPACWEEATGVLTVASTLSIGTSGWTNTAFAHNGLGNIAARMNIWSTNRYEWLLSPSIDLGNGSIPYQVEFDVAITDYFNASAPTGQGGLMGSDDKLVLVISTDNGNTWSDTNILEIWDTANMPSFAGDYFYYDLTAAGYIGEVRFGLYAESSISNEDNDAFVDNFAVVQVPTCPRPLKLTFDSATQTTANLSWTNGSNDISWILEYGAPGFTRGTGTQVSSATNPAVINGLVNSTCYDVYLMSICGAGDSSLWIGPTRFCTDCAPVVDLCEGFENYSAGELPICWSSFLSTTGSSTIGINTFGAYQGTNMVRMNSGSDANATMILVSPEMTALGAGTHRASFWLQGSFNPDTTMIIGTMSDPTNPGTFTPWDTIKNVTTAYQFYRIAFDTYTGTDRHVAFLYPATATFKSMSIDEFCFEVIPTCEKAPFVTVLNSGQDSTTIRLGWNVDTSQVSFFTAYGPTGYDPITNTAGGDTVTTTNNLQIVNGLNSLTEYCFWVKAICTNGDTSAWSGPFCGSTGCPSSASIPYSQDFSSYTFSETPLCWEEAQGALGAAPSFLAMGTSQWAPDGFGNVGTTGSARMEIWSTGRSEWIVSPSLNLGQTQGRHIRVEFDVAATLWNNTNPAIFGDDDTLALVISRNNGQSWSTNDILALWDTGNIPSVAGDRIVLDLPNETGIVKFGFYASSTVNNQDNNVYIDNFLVYDSVFVGVQENDDLANFKVFPNPNTGLFTILNEGNANTSSLKIVDVQGRLVYDDAYFFNQNGRKQIDMTNMEAGVYVLLIQGNGKLEQHRIIISK